MPIELGELRRGQVITTFGPGAIIDFRSKSGGPVSVVAAGLDEWDRWAGATGTGRDNSQTISEPRLQRLLRVDAFRLPPVVPKDEDGRYETNDRLIGARFPTWLFCATCHRLRRAGKWAKVKDWDPARICRECSKGKEEGTYAFAVPVRFITICAAGHLDEFPWSFWVGHREGCPKSGDLELEGTGSGMRGLVLSCRECKSRTTMDGCFAENALEHAPCDGNRPWLGDRDPDPCGQARRTVYRGASNVHFPVLVSALDIPPWSDDLQKLLSADDWYRLKHELTPAERLQFVKLFKLHEKVGLSTPEEATSEIEARIAAVDDVAPESIRPDEHRAFVKGAIAASDREFRVEDREIAPELAPYLELVKCATRLREVRAMKAFTRFAPAADWQDRPGLKHAPLARATDLRWLPAAEIKGEGIFLELNKESLRAWEDNPEVVDRAAELRDAFERDWTQRYGPQEPVGLRVTARYLLTHALSHVLMRQLAVSAGYSSASIAERLYVSDGPYDMAGLLLYTSASDADGTLGGLSRQADAQRLLALVANAIRSAEWCSNDPLCIQSVQSTSERTNKAACHACMMAPETGCERFNRLLDRWVLVGEPGRRDLGMFGALLEL